MDYDLATNLRVDRRPAHGDLELVAWNTVLSVKWIGEY